MSLAHIHSYIPEVLFNVHFVLIISRFSLSEKYFELYPKSSFHERLLWKVVELFSPSLFFSAAFCALYLLLRVPQSLGTNFKLQKENG